MIRAVIFDLGHTIWDITPGDGSELDLVYAEFRSELASRLNGVDVPIASSLRAAITAVLAADADTYLTTGPLLEQPPTHHWVGIGLQSLGLEVDEDLVRELTPPLFATEIDRLVCHEGTVDALLDLRRRGIALGCVTNTLADAATIRQMLRNHGLLDTMGSVVVSSEEGYRKPHPAIFEKALAQLGVGPHEALFVGDSPYHDIGGAKAVGMRVVLTRQYVSRPWIEGVPQPDATIDHVRELRDVVGRMN